MLCHRRQPFPQRDTAAPFHLLSTSQTASVHLDHLPDTPVSPALPPVDYKLLQSCLLATTPATTAPPAAVLDCSPVDQLMTDAFDFQSPAIRIQQPTPAPAAVAAAQPRRWDLRMEPNGAVAGSPSLHAAGGQRRSRAHNRAASASSIGSSDSAASTYRSGHATSFPYLGGPADALALSPSYPHKVESSPYRPSEASRPYSNHLPTPSQTPTHDSFLTAHLQSHPQPLNLDGALSSHTALKQMMMDQYALPDEDAPGFAHSGRHSVSSYGQDSPATPLTAPGEDFEDKYALRRSGETPPAAADDGLFDRFVRFGDGSDALPDVVAGTMPKFGGTLADDYADELYNPSAAAHTVAPPAQNAALLSPYHRSVVSERLHAAHVARSQSPAAAASRDVSPFRRGSPWLATAAQERERRKAEADAQALRHYRRREDEPQKTISPKEALLDYHDGGDDDDDDAKAPLFPDAAASFPAYNHHHHHQQQQQHRRRRHHGLDYPALGPKHDWPAPKPARPSDFSAAPAPSPPQPTTFTFAPPAVAGTVQIPFAAQQYRPVSSAMPSSSAHEPTPEFPAHLTSMESSASEAGPDSSNGQAAGHRTAAAAADVQKPAATTADTGTYTCTYHGCTLRFETPQKLQKHKREAHRQSAVQTTPGVGSGMTSAALAARNSQAGPHKCERINPTTGKPCNTVFSRPYDLTRHEDTIHNSRKQKVRCALCVEEKTFSRNDALTRHMRVVHPEVDFPGKHRRRGQASHD